MEFAKVWLHKKEQRDTWIFNFGILVLFHQVTDEVRSLRQEMFAHGAWLKQLLFSQRSPWGNKTIKTIGCGKNSCKKERFGVFPPKPCFSRFWYVTNLIFRSSIPVIALCITVVGLLKYNDALLVKTTEVNHSFPTICSRNITPSAL